MGPKHVALNVHVHNATFTCYVYR